MEMSNQISAQELKNKNLQILPEKAPEFSNCSFWHYTSLNKANLILRGNSFWLSCVKETNDQKEAKLYERVADCLYVLSFCNSNTEKIPMWYLYSGITGEGVSIGLTPTTMKNFINSIHAVQVIKNGKLDETAPTLKKGEDFEVLFGWVYYRKCDRKSSINYKRTWYEVVDSDLFEKENYFIKDYPWEYEKEFRIVIKTKEHFEKIALALPEENYKNIKIKLAPEISKDESKESVVEKLSKMDGFQKLLYNKMERSNLGISMGLCKKNQEEITQHRNVLIDSNNACLFCKSAKQKMQCGSAHCTNEKCTFNQ